MESRVVPGRSNAITRSSPTKVFNSVDLPTLGRPTMAIFGCVTSASSSLASGKDSRTISISSRTPSPCAPETATGVPKPNSKNSAFTTLLFMPSVLLTARTIGRPVRRSLSAMILSCGAIPDRPSTRNTMASPSSTACNVCLAISARMPVSTTGSKPPVSTTR